MRDPKREIQNSKPARSLISECAPVRFLRHPVSSIRLLASCLFALLLAMPVSAQYALDWWTIGGGGTSTGGVYAVSGTIGQPDAGVMSCGSFTLTGGFWSVITVVPTPGGPVLGVELTATNSVIVWWPAPTPGWILEQSAQLTPTTWTPSTIIPVETNGVIQVILAAPVGHWFYRLHKP